MRLDKANKAHDEKMRLKQEAEVEAAVEEERQWEEGRQREEEREREGAKGESSREEGAEGGGEASGATEVAAEAAAAAAAEAGTDGPAREADSNLNSNLHSNLNLHVNMEGAEGQGHAQAQALDEDQAEGADVQNPMDPAWLAPPGSPDATVVPAPLVTTTPPPPTASTAGAATASPSRPRIRQLVLWPEYRKLVDGILLISVEVCDNPHFSNRHSSSKYELMIGAITKVFYKFLQYH